VLTFSRLDHTARLWDADSGQPIAVFPVGRGEMLQAVFSPSNHRVLTLSNGQIRLWDAADGRLLLSFEADPRLQPFRRAAFSADGRRIIAISGASTPRIWVWDADDGHILQTTDGQSSTMVERSSSLTDAQFSPDGLRFVTTSNDGRVQLWDAATGAKLITLPGVSATASRPVFSPDGRRLAVSFSHDTVKVWQLLGSPPYHDPNASTLVQREVPDIVEWLTGRYRLARRRLSLLALDAVHLKRSRVAFVVAEWICDVPSLGGFAFR
jgi:WD40 repeat protein